MKLIIVQEGQEELAVNFVKYANETLSTLRSYPLTIRNHKICVDDSLIPYSDTIDGIYNCYADFKAGFKE